MQLFIVDAFTSTPFRGNPAAVCLLDEARDDSWMAAVAAEMNLSETAFVRDDGSVLQLRWFTPKVEVELCGHATLAAAHVLYETGRVHGPIQFETRSGPLGAERAADGLIHLDFPARPPVPCTAPPGLEAIVGAHGFVGVAGDVLFVELASPDAVAALTPSTSAVAALPYRALLVAAATGSHSPDVVSRYFAPSVGIDEDPVTGSAHCVLGPYFGERLGLDRLEGYQASARGGTVQMRVQHERVELAGTAVTVLRGEL